MNAFKLEREGSTKGQNELMRLARQEMASAYVWAMERSASNNRLSCSTDGWTFVNWNLQAYGRTDAGESLDWCTSLDQKSAKVRGEPWRHDVGVLALSRANGRSLWS